MTSKIFTRIGSCLAAAGLLAGIALAAPATNADPAITPGPKPTATFCDGNNPAVGLQRVNQDCSGAVDPNTDPDAPVE